MFFILGMPRSGTKLLRSILNQHPIVTIPDIETDFFSFLVAKAELIGDCSTKENFSTLYNQLRDQPFFIFLADTDSVPSEMEWHKTCTGYNPAEIFEGLLRLVTNSVDSGKTLLGDKSPAYINQIDILRTHFPNARYIHIVRDVRDYCLSINKAWGKNMFRAATNWARSIETLQVHLETLGEQAIELRYEDLLSDAETEIRRICSFLSIDFEESMLHLKNSPENIGDTKGLSEIIPTNTKKYVENISKADLTVIEQLSCNMLRNYRYDVSWNGNQHKLGVFKEGYYQCLDAANLVSSTMDERGLVGAIKLHWNHFKATRA